MAPTLPTLTLIHPIPPQLLYDVLTGACEGGSHYWLAAQRVERDADLNVLRVVGPGDVEADREPFDEGQFESGFPPNPPLIDATTVARGIQRLFEPGVLPARNDLRASVLAAVTNHEDSDLDALDYDVILQLGFFGDLVYG